MNKMGRQDHQPRARQGPMMQHDGAALRVLYIGGTGTISTSCVRLSVESGMPVFVLNRGNNSAARPTARWRHLADRRRHRRRLAACGASGTSTSTPWSTSSPTTPTTSAGWSRCSAPAPAVRAHQLWLHLRQAGPAVARSPSRRPIGPNPVLEYATAKWRAELALQQARTDAGLPGHHRPALAHLRRREPAAARRLDGRGPDRPRAPRSRCTATAPRCGR